MLKKALSQPLYLIVYLMVLPLFIDGPCTVVGAEGQQVSTELLAEERPFATELFIVDSGVPGPIVMLTGGIHGNEPAGTAAARQIIEWPLICGKLVCIPACNQPALRAKQRFIPSSSREMRDLNRNFVVLEDFESPTRNKVALQGELAETVWDVVDRFQPDWLIDLHEGVDFGRTSNSVGNSVIVVDDPQSLELADQVIAYVDAEIDNAEQKFLRRGPPIEGSLARAAYDAKGIRSMILETTSKSQSLAVRCRQHRRMVAALLTRLDMLENPNVADQLISGSETPHLNIALFDDRGVAGKGIPSLLELWQKESHVTVDRVSASDIRAGSLNQFDVLCCSGGSGSGQAKSLGASGREEIRQFVENGGSYVGICAGSYLACSGFSWGLGILDAKTKSNDWRRGRAVLPVRFTSRGQQWFATPTPELNVLYANGPIIEPDYQDSIPDFDVLAFFAEEIAENATPAGIMKDSPAIVLGQFGEGQVLCLSPHAEQTSEAKFLIKRLLEKLSGNGSAAGRNEGCPTK